MAAKNHLGIERGHQLDGGLEVCGLAARPVRGGNLGRACCLGVDPREGDRKRDREGDAAGGGESPKSERTVADHRDHGGADLLLLLPALTVPARDTELFAQFGPYPGHFFALG